MKRSVRKAGRGLVPSPPTHTLVVDMLDVDGSVKRVSVDYTSTDRWANAYSSAFGIGEMLLAGLSSAFRQDIRSAGYRAYIVDRKTGTKIKGFEWLPVITRPEMFI